MCELNIVCTAVCGVEVSCEGVQWGTERRWIEDFVCELKIVCTALCGVEVICEVFQWGTERRWVGGFCVNCTLCVLLYVVWR